jgi:2-keto-4-pentenoate hydratase/2-oxohepta-3-ene-1,7-dioic acid hydratase in catechol pathway
MRLITFARNDGDPELRLGVFVRDDAILDLAAAAGNAKATSFASMLALIDGGDAAVGLARTLLGQATEGAHAAAIRPLGQVKLAAPIPHPRKNVFCVGRNYVDHIAEGAKARGLDLKLPEYPQFFTKPATTVIAVGDEIPRHAEATAQLDYEVELGVIIGKTGADITEDRWHEHVFGYTIINDVTARDLQRRHDQWFKGKSLDGFCPMGPWIVHRDALAAPQQLPISLTVNGEVRQSANTSQMIFHLPRIIAELSKGLTLEAGDVIATGTPSGVGYAMTPPHFLQVGDLVTCRIEGIGVLENRVGQGQKVGLRTLEMSTS